jgi:hypothetical protein
VTQIAAYIAFGVLSACFIAAGLATVRYAVKLQPQELNVRVLLALFGICLVLAAAIFFMWRV